MDKVDVKDSSTDLSISSQLAGFGPTNVDQPIEWAANESTDSGGAVDTPSASRPGGGRSTGSVDRHGPNLSRHNRVSCSSSGSTSSVGNNTISGTGIIRSSGNKSNGDNNTFSVAGIIRSNGNTSSGGNEASQVNMMIDRS